MLHDCGHSVDWAVDLDEHDPAICARLHPRCGAVSVPLAGGATGLPSEVARDHEGPRLVRLVANEVWYQACPQERLEDARRNREVALRPPAG